MTDPLDAQIDAEWWAAVEAALPTCLCGHVQHATNCPNVACGCLTYRPKEATR